MFETALDPREVLTSIAFAAAPNSAYAKFHHPASGYAVVGAAVKLTLAAGRIDAARVAFTGVGDAPFRAHGVEAALAGVKTGDATALDAACRDAAAASMRGATRLLRVSTAPPWRTSSSGGRSRRHCNPADGGSVQATTTYRRGSYGYRFSQWKRLPRRGRDRIGDFYWLARVFDKARAKRDDTIFDYIYPCPIDRGVFERWASLGAVRRALKTIDTDEAILAWAKSHISMRSAKRRIPG